MSEIDLKKVIITAVLSAHTEYDEMTLGDCGVTHTPEYWYTTKIGIGVKNSLRNYSVILETPMSEFHDFSDIRRGRTSNAYRKSGQTDIALWSCDESKENWKPHCIIEVKKAWRWNDEIDADIARIHATMHESKNVRVGYFVAITDAVAESEKAAMQLIKNRITTFKTSIQATYPNLKIVTNREFSAYSEKVIAAAIVFEFTLKEQRV